jgi:glycosyltransferase involved in cell wall biosynthesis
MAGRAGLDEEYDVQFHILSFEGPDIYARAGGLASRISSLTEALAQEGFETHLWFIGHPDLPDRETTDRLTLHRWCQWISHYHRDGVYDGEEGKLKDYSASLPPALLRDYLAPRLEQPDRRAVILAEEWQTVDAVLHLDALLKGAGLRDRVAIFWNANNIFGFDRIDWRRLAAAATITTVSRFMRHLMWKLGVDPLVIPNGISAEYLRPPERRPTAVLRHALRDRLLLTKVARWDPDKRWLLAIDTVAQLKRLGWRPLLLARGGVEAHGTEVLSHARTVGLQVAERWVPESRERDLLLDPSGLGDVDVVSIKSYLTPPISRILYRVSAAVLANSGREPFGLVGLETMAAGGVACIGGTGEDYAVPGWNALLLQTQDPRELIGFLLRILSKPAENRAIRARATATARRYTWSEIIWRDLLPRLLLAMDRNRSPASLRKTRPSLPRRREVVSSENPTEPHSFG